MDAEIIRCRYNLKTKLREEEEIVNMKEVPDNYDVQVLDMLVKQMTNDCIISSTSLTSLHICERGKKNALN